MKIFVLFFCIFYVISIFSYNEQTEKKISKHTKTLYKNTNGEKKLSKMKINIDIT